MPDHRRFAVPVLLLALFLSANREVAAQATCNVKAQLEAYLKNFTAKDPNRELIVLAFDHQERTWTGYQWQQGSLNDRREIFDLKLPFTNKPRVFVPKGRTQDLVVVLTNTNPLLFTTRLTATTETSIEDLQSLQKLAGLLGGFLSAGVASAAPEFEVAPISTFDVNVAFRANVDVFEAGEELVETGDPAGSSLDQLYADSVAIVEELKVLGSVIEKALKALETPRAGFDGEIRLLKEAGSEIRSYLQQVENGNLSSAAPRGFERLTVSAASLDGLAQNIARERDNLRNNVQPACVDALTALRTAVRLYRIPLSERPAEQRPVTDEFKASLEALANPSSCGSSQLDIRIGRVRGYLKDRHEDPRGPRPPNTQGASEAEDRILRPLFRGIDGYLTLVDQRKSALEVADKLVSETGDSAKVAEAAQTFIARRSGSLLSNDPCSLTTGVIPIPRNSALTDELPWTKFGTESFQISIDSPFKDSVVLRHATDVSSSYEIQRAWRWDFDVDVATVYTEIASPVFTSVPTLNLATPDKPDDTVNIVRQTDEQGRAGELAMFLGLQWRPRKGAASTFSIGPQLGAGLSADHPAVFAGVGFGLGRYVKLGVGWNWQEVKELRNQKVDQILELGESVQTRDAFDDGYYVSLSITIDELPFFKAP